MLHLPDVSEFQLSVDWPAVVKWQGGEGAAIIRAHNGYRPDKCWFNGARRTAARRAGVRALGLYLYLAHDRDPTEQAREFAELVGRLEPGEFAVVDLEEGAGDQLHRAEAALDELDHRLTYPGYHGTWLYSGQDFAINHGLVPIFRSRRPTWLAAYAFREPTDPRVAHSLWQHTDGHYGARHPMPGVDTAGPDYTDCSLYHGTVAQLVARIHA